ncbi:MAG: hypothetical protein ABSE55_17925 [Terracidiphilus sp.]|jgi:hypothetical protein
MPLLTVTLGSGATRFTTLPLRAMQLRARQGASASFIGDSSAVATTTGIPVKVASPTADPTTIGPFTSGAINLNQWYAIGTAADVVNIQYTPEE